MANKKRIAVVVSHPIQHFCPQYESWATLPEVELRVFFASSAGSTAYVDKNFGRLVKWEGLRLDFPHEFLPGAEGRAPSSKIDSVELEGRLMAFSPDVLVVYGYSQRLQRRALRWGKSAIVPTVMISDSELRARRSWLKRTAKLLILPSIYRNVTLFLSVGDANEAYYRKYRVRDDQLVRCFFPIDVRHYDAIMIKRDECRARVRAQLGIPESHKVILMVGKLVRWKRQGDLIHASNFLQDIRQDVSVILAGTGPDEGGLRAMARRIGAGGVLFAGFVTPEILAEYYTAADVYVHCSEREPHSLAISEAIYCGLPVILTDRCGSFGPSDDVRPGLNGLVYRCGNTSDLLSKLLRLIDNPDTLTCMGGASRRIGRWHQELAHKLALTQALRVLDSARLS